MKAIRSPKIKQAASSLLVALIITTILSLSILGYLTVVEQQNMLGARSQVWNMSIAVVEAGIEEGLEQLNCNPNSLGADHWTYDGTSYSKHRDLPDGNSYDVKINASSPSSPIISCRANVNPPTFVRNQSTAWFAAMGTPAPTPSPIQRAVLVRTSKGNLFTAALVVKQNIDLKGNGVYTDSYDSSNPNKSSNGGKYDSSKYSGDHGDIASNGGITNSIGVQNANIYGTIHTGPQCPVSIGSQGGVGPHGAQVGDVTTAKNLGYILEDANFTFPDTSLPSDYASYLPPQPGSTVTWSNIITSWSTNTTSWPTNSPWGGVTTNSTLTTYTNYPGSLPPGSTILTNNAGYVTVSSLPNPIPYGLITNTIAVTTNTYPNPKPADLSTNLATSQVNNSGSYPAAGTYVVGSVTTNWNGGHNHITGYNYTAITGYTYSYTYKTYTYPILAYIVQTPSSYTFSQFATNTIYYTNSYNYVLNANTKYVASGLSGTICVAGPNVVLVMPNGLSGSENFTFNQGANVLVYSGGTSVSINGNQYLNPNFYPGSFIVYCTPSVTSFTLNGNGQFTGVLVAPNATITMNGGGNSNEDFCGSLMVGSCRMNGHFSFHYDESLSHQPSNGRFLISGWDEIDPKTF